MLDGKKIAVLGAGRSGVAAAALACHLGGEVTLYDAGEISSAVQERLGGVNFCSQATVEMGQSVSVDTVVVSPGIDTYGEFVQAFAQNAQELIGEVELAARVYQGKIIAITGTNGKTTTTEIVQHVLSSAGVSCVACGNYGVPLAEVVMAENVPEAIALELSSFQLETTQRLTPDVIIWLNFSEDHMDRYPDLASYKRAKLRIFQRVSEATLIVVRSGEQIGEHSGKRVEFSSESKSHEKGAQWGIERTMLLNHGQPIFDLNESKLRGLHNAENVMAAAAACSHLGVENEIIWQAMESYQPPRHRCEFVRQIGGVDYINDSKATNLHALSSAIRSFEQPMRLIIGGKQKGLDYQGVLTMLSPKIKAIYAFGEIAEELYELFSAVVPTRAVENLQDALRLVRESAVAGDLVLFSPGTSSFDQYSGYEARGDHFRELVSMIENTQQIPS